MTRKSSPAYHTVSDSDASDFIPSPPAKRAKLSTRPTKAGQKRKPASSSLPDIEDAVPRPHGSAYHSVGDIASHQASLLSWFEHVREKRGMPWRKRYDPDMSIEDKAQRAYEIWVSEVMLQQTQVATVIDYWRRWMERWPTIADLAKADIEQVNAAWRGLGYYRRARSLLKGAQTVKNDLKGRLPQDPAALEKQVDGVGRYTAGAISSMAYGVRAPIVDGNVHRLLTRLLALHANQTSPATIKFLWQAAEELVDALPEVKGVAGDWNQALMELGSQVCKPTGPDCSVCPLRPSCKAYAELTASPPLSKPPCTLCEPMPVSGTPSVTVFPMKKTKKESREEHEVVCVVEWHHADDCRWLFTKRPDKGLLAGLFQPPTTPVPSDADEQSRLSAAAATVQSLIDHPLDTSSHRFIRSIPHIFSHINMTYHITHLTLTTPQLPATTGIWLDSAGVESANVGTGVKKVWSEIYGSWGSFDASAASTPKKRTAATKSAAKPVAEKVVKRVMMPAMPVRVSKAS